MNTTLCNLGLERANSANSSAHQSEKKQILRRLNQNLKARSPVDEMEETPPAPSEPSLEQSEAEKLPPSDGDRKKWEVAELPLLPVPQQTLGETCSTSGSEFKLSY